MIHTINTEELEKHQENIQKLRQWGFYLIGLKPGERTALTKYAEFNTRVPNEAEQIQLLERVTTTYGIFVGAPYGIIVLDFESEQGETDFCKGRQLPRTVTAQTRRYRHYYFKHPGCKLRTKIPHITKDLDVKSIGYVGAPGSIHPKSGQPYHWLITPDESELAELPDWAIEQCRISDKQHEESKVSKTQGTLDGELFEKVADNSEGERNNNLFQASRALGTLVKGGFLDRNRTLERLLNLTPLSKEEAQRTIESGFIHPLTLKLSLNADYFDDSQTYEDVSTILFGLCPEDYEATQMGAAGWIRDLFGRFIRFDHEKDAWYIWSGKAWRLDQMNAMIRITADASILRELASEIRHTNSEELTKHLYGQRNVATIKAVLTLASSMNPIATTATNWNPKKYLVAVKNGVIDLRTKELRKAEPEDMINRLIPVDYNPDAQGVRWNIFLEDVTKERKELIEFLQLCVGYSMTADTREQVFFVFLGGGSNGKGVFRDTIQMAMSEYAIQTGFNLFEQRRDGDHPERLERLDQARFVFVGEADAWSRWNVKLVRELAGEDKIVARAMYGTAREFQPVCKLWFSFNELPSVNDNSIAFWRRCIIIPFEVSFENNPDGSIRNDLKKELQAVLAWAVEGAYRYYDGRQKHLKQRMPEYLLEYTEEYRKQSNPFLQFLEERVIELPGSKTKASDLHGAYLDYCRAMTIPEGQILNSTAFGRILKTKGFAVKKERDARYYVGVKLLPKE